MSEALDLFLELWAPATPNAALDLMLGTGLSYGTPTPTGALDLFDFGHAGPGTPLATPANTIWRPTYRPRRR